MENRMYLALVFLALMGCKDSGDIPGQSTELDWSSHQWASWSPNGRSVAFTAQINGVTGIYLIDTSGQDLRLVIAAPASGGTTWSPDGHWIASSWYGNLFRVKSTGDSLTFLTNSGKDFFPAWSPDGSLITFSRTICDPDCGVFTISPDGAGERLLHMFGLYPSWFPSSDRVVFPLIDWLQGRYTGYSFWVAHLDSTSASRVFSIETTHESKHLDVSPLSEVIAYSRKPPGRYSQVWHLNLTTGAHSQLTTDGGAMPSWSPDASKIVYTRTQERDGGLWIMNSDGGGKRRLTQPTH
jgi:Tol biopolymer transport system component